MKIKYTNEHLRKQVKENMTLFKFIVGSIIVSVLLIVSSPLSVYIQKVSRIPIPFDKIKPSFAPFTMYYAQITEPPVKIGETGYYIADIDGHKFPVKLYAKLYANIRRDLDRDGTAWIHGTINTEEKSEIVMQIYKTEESQEIIDAATLVFYKNSYKYLDCFDYNLYNETLEVNPVGMVFGISWLIVTWVGIKLFGSMNMIKHLHPACGDSKFTVKEIDDQANSPEAVWYGNLGIYLAPKIMIGSQKGVTAAVYGDIVRVSVKTKLHIDKRYDYYTYQIIVKTRKGKRLKFSDAKGFYEPAYKEICDRIREASPDVEVIDPPKQK